MKICKDCGTDISHRGNRAKYCEEHGTVLSYYYRNHEAIKIKRRVDGSTRIRCSDDEAYPERRRALRASYQRKRTADKIQATPSWANLEYIKLFYIGAKKHEAILGEQVDVDHIVPLKGKLVCGLHCEDNLQFMLATDNSKKNNKFEVS